MTLHARLKNLKWKTLLGLAIIVVAVIYNLNWLWGVFFLYWLIPSLISGVTYFVEPIRKHETPILYWIIILMWLLLSLALILEPILTMIWVKTAFIGVT